MSHPASIPVDELMADCSVVRTRRSGPGGQHRNKVETAVVITHRPTGLQASAAERRSQAENLAQAQFRLRMELALKVRRLAEDESPSPLWRRRATKGRIAVNPRHADFPALLAEALDVLEVCRWSPVEAGARLKVTGSQIVKLLKLEPEAILLLNARRVEAGLRPCR